MSDFDQTEFITTLRMYGGPIENLEEELSDYAMRTNVALVLPASYREFGPPEGAGPRDKPVYNIIDTLDGIPPYIHEIVMPLGQADEGQYRHARSELSRLERPERKADIIWINSPRVQKILERISQEVGPVGNGKKGQGQWLSDGLIIGRGESGFIAHHDCDIRTYSREMLGNLLHPPLQPDMNFEYGTGYYARIGDDDRMNGRVTRLFMNPLLASLRSKARQCSPDDEAHNLIRFLLSHKYLLSGEGFKSADFAMKQRTTDDYDLETVEKMEAFRKLRKSQICQKAIANRFDHFHQQLTTDDGKGGLTVMASTITRALYDGLISYGMELGHDTLNAIGRMYLSKGQDFEQKYWADAVSRGLVHERSGEERSIETFSGVLRDVHREMLDDDGIYVGGDMVNTIPNWERVHSAYPDVYRDLIDAVEHDKRI